MIDMNWTHDELNIAIHSGGVALWSWHPESRIVDLDPLAQGFWGVDSPRQTLDMLFERMDDRDRERAMRDWSDSAASTEPYDFAFRIFDGARTRWISARGDGVSSNRPDGTVLAIFLDITREKEVEETQRLLVREMVHRIGNLFAVASSVTALVSRNAPDVKTLVADLRTRFEQLRAGFTYAARTGDGELRPMPLAAVLHELLRPHATEAESFAIDVPHDISTGPDQMTHLALIMHELATNAVKYGALSEPAGRISIRGRTDDDRLRLTWRETGGPATKLPQSNGFGTRLLEQTVAAAFSGTVSREMTADGLTVKLDLDRGAFLTRV